MSKDPAFLFYPNDYIGGTMGMTFEEKGAYMELLMMQFNRGHMTSHMIGQTIGQLWVNLKDKFTQDEDGLWYNVRLDDEQTRRRKFTESRVNNRSGKNQYNKKERSTGGHMTSHMENETVNENIVVNKKKRGSKGGSKPSKCLMKNSGVTQKMIQDSFNRSQDLKMGDPLHYFNSALSWSDSKGEMRVDWVATVANFARRDVRDGKLKIRKREPEKPRVDKGRDYGVISSSAGPIPKEMAERIKKSAENIGKEPNENK